MENRFTIENFNIEEPSVLFDNKKQQIVLTLVDYNYEEVCELQKLLNNNDVDINCKLAERQFLIKKIKKLNNKIHDLEFNKRNIDKIISDLPTVIDLCISECLSLKLSLRNKVCLMENSEHCFPQNAVLWSDIVSIIDKRVKDLKS